MSTGQISKIENADSEPAVRGHPVARGDTPVNVTVHSATSNFKRQSQGGKALVLGTVAPGNGHVKGTVAVFARAVGKKGAFKKVATQRLATSQGNFAISVPLAAGRWNDQGEVPGSEAGSRRRDLANGQGDDRGQAGLERQAELGQDPKGRVHGERRRRPGR